MKNLIIGFALLGGLTQTQAHAQSHILLSTGGGNGGQTVYRGTNAYLRDLVDKNNCIWKNATQIFKEAPLLNGIFDKFSALNLPFSLRLGEELTGLSYCFTNKDLPALAYSASEDIYVFSNEKYDQVAINDKGMVFVDQKIFKQMDAENKAYLFLHEASHELFDKSEERSSREPRLREFLLNVSTQLNELHSSLNYEAFNQLIEIADFRRLEDVTTLDPAAFNTVFLNQGLLEARTASLKKLPFRVGKDTQGNFQIKGKLFSKKMINNLISMEKERAEAINVTMRQTNFSATIANIPNLLNTYEKLDLLALEDKNQMNNIFATLEDLVQENDLKEHKDLLVRIFKIIDLSNPSITYSKFIASNYDAAYGDGMFATQLMYNTPYLKLVIFGKINSYKTECIKNCNENSQKSGNILKSTKALGKKDESLYASLSAYGRDIFATYLFKQLISNTILKDKIKQMLLDDIAYIKANGVSEYYMKDVKKRSSSNAELTVGEKFDVGLDSDNIRMRELLIQLLK